MWIFWSIIAILLFAFCEIYEKKASNIDEDYTELKMLIWFGIFSLLVIVGIKILGLRELDMNIIEFLSKNPVVIFSPIFYMLSLLFAFISLKYIPVSIEVPITNTNGIYCFLGAIILYAILGKFDEVREEVTIIKIILVIVVTITIIFSSIIYNNYVYKNKESEEYKKLRKKISAFALFGILLAFLSALCDAGDSIITYYMFEEVCGTYDFLYVYYSINVIIAVFAYIYLIIRTKKIYNPFLAKEKCKMIGAGLDCAGTVASNLAVAANPFFADPLMSTYFIFTIIFSRFILKEKFDKKQYICIAVILVCVFVFVVLDNQ